MSPAQRRRGPGSVTTPAGSGGSPAICARRSPHASKWGPRSAESGVHDARSSTSPEGSRSARAPKLCDAVRVTVPDAAHVHVFVARGAVDFEGVGRLDQGDAVRLTDAGSPTLTAGPDGSEVVIWETA